MKSLGTFFRRLANESFWGYGLFWSWNAIFLAFMFLGFAPYLLPELIRSVREGITPVIFVVYAVTLALIPALAVVLGASVLRRSPGKLLALGYGVEGPLMIMLGLRFFLIRDDTPAVDLLLSGGGLAILTLLWQLLDTKIDQRPVALGYLRVGGLALLLLLGIYAGVTVGFYAVPLAAELPTLVWEMGRELWSTFVHFDWKDFAMLPFVLFGTVLMLYTTTLVIVMPVAVPVLYVRHWGRGLKALAARQSWLRPALLTGGVVALVAVLAVLTNQQPQHKAYALLETPPASPEQAATLRQQDGAIRAGLLNAYLAPLRYFSAVGEVGHIENLYEWSLKLPPQVALQVEKVYEIVVRPMLYEPMAPAKLVSNPERPWEQRALTQDPQTAARLYEAYFDQPIFKGERQEILSAVRATWSAEQALAGWQAVDEREVLLVRQEINIGEHGDWAEVELYEEYANQTYQRQEVVYYFSLPESAVVTGIWLGDSPDRQQRYEYHVAPRGAAQAVYRNEVRYNRDPALIEQLGPRQYRLRIFPIEPRHWTGTGSDGQATSEDGKHVYFWMTYQVLADGNTWPLPALAERRNIYWDEHTTRRVNGQAAFADDPEAWMRPSVTASHPIEATTHRVTFPSGETVTVRPVTEVEKATPPAGLHIAVVLDRSGSMATSAASVQSALDYLAGFQVDVYLTTSPYRGEVAARVGLASLDSRHITYLGGQNAADLLPQFLALSQGKAYDAILVLTDGTGFKLGGEARAISVPQAPVWMVHLDGRMPLGYDDATLQALQASGGGVARSADEALTRLAFAVRQGNPSANEGHAAWVDGYEWTTTPAAGKAPSVASVEDEAFAALAARALILDAMQRQRTHLDTFTLDALHAIAQEYHIVTPYSSMIVLVTTQQEELLQELEENEDRFQREAEAVGETVSTNPFQVTGVPEPHEWLLLGLVGVMILVYWLRRR